MQIQLGFIPMAQAQVGMVLGKLVSIVQPGCLSLTLPAGHVLTDENLHQLRACHTEFIGIELVPTSVPRPSSPTKSTPCPPFSLLTTIPAVDDGPVSR